jgi:hypothetical protein
MKKFWFVLGLSLILACWCGGGYYGFGTSAAFGQYYDPRVSCDSRDPYCYRDYHAAPYADPLSQFLYYVAPPAGRDQRYERYENNRERREHNREERRDLREHQRQRY